jgi:TolA-binding protein
VATKPAAKHVHIAAAHEHTVITAPAADPAPPAADSPAPVDTPPPAAETPAPPAPPSGPREIERHFQSGMALLKAGKAAEAARELSAAADAGGDDPLAADARYFSAVALTKAGRKTEAERALVAFLDGAKTSIRRGRAAVMLARLIAERGDSKAARAWFESALGDADASVVAAARAGIAALH